MHIKPFASAECCSRCKTDGGTNQAVAMIIEHRGGALIGVGAVCLKGGVMTDDCYNEHKQDKTYTEIERFEDYVKTSKTSGTVKLFLASREFKSQSSKCNTYDL